MQQSTIVGLAIGAAAVIGTVIGFTLWNSSEPWDVKVAEEQIGALTDDYNAAIAEQPGDWRRATFVFDVKAKKRMEAFSATYGECIEFNQFKRDFESQCKHLRKALRKV